MLGEEGGTASELDLRKLLISEFVDRVSADSVDVLLIEKGGKRRLHPRGQTQHSIERSISPDRSTPHGGGRTYLRMLTGWTPARSDESELVSGRYEGGAAAAGAGMEKGEGSGS